MNPETADTIVIIAGGIAGMTIAAGIIAFFTDWLCLTRQMREAQKREYAIEPTKPARKCPSWLSKWRRA